MTGKADRRDDKDAAILSALRRNARLPLVALAREIGLSRSATQERLSRLERSGQIQGYTVIVRPEEKNRVRAWLFIKLAENYKCAAVAPVLRGLPETALCHSISGDTDVIALMEAASPQALSELREKVDSLAAVARVSIHFLLEDHFNISGSR